MLKRSSGSNGTVFLLLALRRKHLKIECGSLGGFLPLKMVAIHIITGLIEGNAVETGLTQTKSWSLK